MTWHTGPQDRNKLQELANLTARIIRLSLHQKIAAGDTLLKAKGLRTALSKTYKKHAIAERKKVVDVSTEETPNLLNITETGTW